MTETIHEKLVEAAGEGEMEQVRLLIDSGADVDYDAGAPLKAAAYKGGQEVGVALLEAGADLDLAMATNNPSNAPKTHAGLKKLEALDIQPARYPNGFRMVDDHTVMKRTKITSMLSLRHVFNFQTRQVTTVALNGENCGVTERNFQDYGDDRTLEQAYSALLEQGGQETDWQKRSAVRKDKPAIKLPSQ